MPFFGSKKKVKLNGRRDANGKLMSLLDLAKKNFPIRSSFFEYQRSKISGVGVVAIRFIPKDERIMEYKGDCIMTEQEYQRRLLQYRCGTRSSSTYVFQVKQNDGLGNRSRCLYVDATVNGNAARYINHSCLPNCVAYQDERQRIIIYAKVDIVVDAELTLDYALSGANNVRCRCGSDNCRRFI